MNTILFTISTLLLILTIYKYYLTDNFKNKISDKMKKLLFTLALLLSVTSGYCQNIYCDIPVNDSTRELIVVSEYITTYNTSKIYAELSKRVSPKGYSYNILFEILTENNNIINKGDTAKITLRNDSVITLLARDNNKTTKCNYDKKFDKRTLCFYQISDGDLSNLLKVGIKKLNINLSTNSYEYMVENNNMDLTKSYFLLFDKNYYSVLPLGAYSWISNPKPTKHTKVVSNPEVSTSYSTTVVNGHVYTTSVYISGNSYRVHISGNGINSTTYGHY